jgi:hypothetical protein
MDSKHRKPITELSAGLQWALLGEAWERKNRGRSETLQRLEDRAVVVDCVADDQLSAMVSIACEVLPFGVVPLPGEIPADVNPTFPIVGRVEWGNDGAATSADFDFLNGTVITLAAASVRVTCQFDGPFPDEEVPLIPAVVRAHVGYMPRAGLSAQRTKRATGIASGAQVAWAIPKFAKHVRIVRTPAGAIGVTLLGFLGPVAAVTTADPVVALPLPGDARLVIVDNLGPDPIELRGVFDLWI